MRVHQVTLDSREQPGNLVQLVNKDHQALQGQLVLREVQVQ